MPTKVGLDTSFVIGLLDEKDTWHVHAAELQSAFAPSDIRPYVFDCVLSEVISTLARRIQEKRREADLTVLIERLKSHFPSKSITWVYPDLPSLYDEVVNLVQQSEGELNFNDALIALSCRNRDILHLASFDADFDRVSWLTRIALPADIPSAQR